MWTLIPTRARPAATSLPVTVSSLRRRVVDGRRSRGLRQRLEAAQLVSSGRIGHPVGADRSHDRAEPVVARLRGVAKDISRVEVDLAHRQVELLQRAETDGEEVALALAVDGDRHAELPVGAVQDEPPGGRVRSVGTTRGRRVRVELGTARDLELALVGAAVRVHLRVPEDEAGPMNERKNVARGAQDRDLGGLRSRVHVVEVEEEVVLLAETVLVAADVEDREGWPRPARLVRDGRAGQQHSAEEERDQGGTERCRAGTRHAAKLRRWTRREGELGTHRSHRHSWTDGRGGITPHP